MNPAATPPVPNVAVTSSLASNAEAGADQSSTIIAHGGNRPQARSPVSDFAARLVNMRPDELVTETTAGIAAPGGLIWEVCSAVMIARTVSLALRVVSPEPV